LLWSNAKKMCVITQKVNRIVRKLIKVSHVDKEKWNPTNQSWSTIASMIQTIRFWKRFLFASSIGLRKNKTLSIEMYHRRSGSVTFSHHIYQQIHVTRKELLVDREHEVFMRTTNMIIIIQFTTIESVLLLSFIYASLLTVFFFFCNRIFGSHAEFQDFRFSEHTHTRALCGTTIRIVRAHHVYNNIIIRRVFGYYIDERAANTKWPFDTSPWDGKLIILELHCIMLIHMYNNANLVRTRSALRSRVHASSGMFKRTLHPRSGRDVAIFIFICF
jgi:hypothetical protein